MCNLADVFTSLSITHQAPQDRVLPCSSCPAPWRGGADTLGHVIETRRCVISRCGPRFGACQESPSGVWRRGGGREWIVSLKGTMMLYV